MTDLRQAAQQALDALMDDQYRMVEVVGGHYEYKTDLAIGALKAALAQEPTTCAWHGDEEGAYETSCKHIFQMIDGTPQENDFTHCCFCGKALAQHSWEDGNDE